MKFIARLATFVALLAVVDGVIYLVLTNNLRNGVYPVDADSLGIPLMETATLSLVAGGLLLAAAVVSGLRWLHRQAETSIAGRYLVAGLLVITHVAAAALFALWGLSWAVADHYSIVAACVLATVAILYFGAVDLRRLRPNNSFKPNSLRESA